MVAAVGFVGYSGVYHVSALASKSEEYSKTPKAKSVLNLADREPVEIHPIPRGRLVG